MNSGWWQAASGRWQMETGRVVRALLAIGWILACGLVFEPVLAQEPLTAEVDRTALTTDETLQLTVTLAGEGGPPVLPALVDFQIVSSGSSNSITVVNGVMEVQATYWYILRPLTDGELTIGSVNATVDGDTFITPPITVQVNPGSGPVPAPPALVEPPDALLDQDFFVEAFVDNESPYLGEQVIYTFRLYQGAELLGQPLYERPEFTGFWSQETAQAVAPGGVEIVQVNGRTYRVATLQTILFPTVPGRQVIEPARLELPGSFGQNGIELFTDELALEVRSLPAPAPPEFNGAVGQFTLTAQLDDDTVAVNDSLTMRVTLSGAGSLETIPDPIWPEPEEWRVFDNGVTINTRTESAGADGVQRFVGSKVYEKILVPVTADAKALPLLSFVYFDPNTEQYETVTADLLPVTVTGSDPLAAAAPSPSIVADIRSIKQVPPALARAGQPVIDRTWYWGAWLLPLLLPAAVLWRRRRNAAVLRKPGRIHHSRYLERVLAQALTGDADPFAAVNQALLVFLSSQLGRPASGLTESQLLSLLRERGVAAELCNRVQSLLAQSDAGRFAPGTLGDGVELVTAAQRLIDDLEAAWPSD